MKLAEALMERADLNRKIQQLRELITDNLLVQEGESPSQDPAQLMQELDEAVNRLNELMAKINLTNCRTMAEGKTLTELIAEKDTRMLQLDSYRDFVREASQNTRRARGTEIIIRSAVNVSGLQKKADDLAAQIRRLDNTLQMTNWQVDLMEEE